MGQRWTVEQAAARVAAGLAPIIDIRSSVEVAEGAPKDAWHVPLYDLDAEGRPQPNEAFLDQIALLVRRLGGPPMLICGHGMRSRQAAQLLAYAGIDVDEVPAGWHGDGHGAEAGTGDHVGWLESGAPIASIAPGRSLASPKAIGAADLIAAEPGDPKPN